MKCYHPQTKYVGSENSQLFGDRLSIVVPLGRPPTNEDGIVNETIKWAFLCQNSCVTGINRKSTAVIFTLENESFVFLFEKPFSHKQFKIFLFTSDMKSLARKSCRLKCAVAQSVTCSAKIHRSFLGSVNRAVYHMAKDQAKWSAQPK